MFLDIHISVEAALVCGAPRVGRFRVPLSPSLSEKIRERGYVEVAAEYVRESADGTPSHYPALAVHGLGDDALLEGIAAVHATNRDVAAIADRIIEGGEALELPTVPSNHALTRAVAKRMALAEKVLSVRRLYAATCAGDDADHNWLSLEYYRNDCGPDVILAAFGPTQGKAILDEIRARGEERARRRAAEEEARKRDYAQKLAAEQESAANKVRDRKAQRRALIEVLEKSWLGTSDALLRRFDDDLLPESDLWAAVRRWLSRLLDGDRCTRSSTDDLHHEAACTDAGHDVRWKLTEEVKLSADEYERFRAYKERCEALAPEMAAMGLELACRVQRGSWKCRDCDEADSIKLFSMVISTPSEDWTLDVALGDES